MTVNAANHSGMRRARRSVAGLAVVAIAATVSLLLPMAWAEGLGGSTTQSATPDLVARLQSATGGKVQLKASRATGLVRFLTTNPSQPVPKPKGTPPGAEAAARAFLGTYGPLFGVTDQAAMKVLNQRAAPNGRHSVKFNQTHKGIPVIAGELVVGLDAMGNVLSANGEATGTDGVSVTPSSCLSHRRDCGSDGRGQGGARQARHSAVRFDFSRNL